MIEQLLQRLGLKDVNSGVCDGEWLAKPAGEELISFNPATGKPIARVLQGSEQDYDRVAEKSASEFLQWRKTPAPVRGEVVRKLGEELRKHKDDLGLLVTLEMGKIRTEGLGEVQEMIDMCDYAVGLSRQLFGLTIASERPGHRMFEQWLPLGPVGIISAFNFPVAVWSWNAALAAVCGDTMIWKPSSETPLTAIAVQHICNRVMKDAGLSGIFNLCIGSGKTVGERMINDRRVPLISATGSCQMGFRIGAACAKRLARTILELGGNNAIIVSETARLDLALRAALFAAVGTAGQRCTSLRRLIVHESIANDFVEKLKRAYATIKIGAPWEEGVLMGPLVNESAVKDMMAALGKVKEQGGEIVCGGRTLDRPGYFVEPTIVRASAGMTIVAEETFAPILYVLTYKTIEEAIAIQNGVPQGLSSAIFTRDVEESELFLSSSGSDCGIANVNIGTSGAEIGGAFGGEKETGGGREAGSDSWKQYMRRQTCTVNGGQSLPLAQGVKFDLG